MTTLFIWLSRHMPRPAAFATLSVIYALLIMAIVCVLGYPQPDIIYVDVPAAR